MTELEGTRENAGYTIHYNRIRGILNAIADVAEDDLRDSEKNIYVERDESGVVDTNGVQFGAKIDRIDENETIRSIDLRVIVPVEHIDGIDMNADNMWYLHETYDKGQKLLDAIHDVLSELGWVDDDSVPNFSPSQVESGSVNVGFRSRVNVSFEDLYPNFTPVNVVGINVVDYTVFKHDDESVYDAINRYTWFHNNPNQLGDITIPYIPDGEYYKSLDNSTTRNVVEESSYNIQMADEVDGIDVGGFERYITNADGQPQALISGDRENIAGLMRLLLFENVFGEPKTD